jgi:hypothetical protein
MENKINIFAVHDDPIVASKMLCDKHINKMTVESAQMLSTVHRMLDGKLEYRLSKSGKRKVKYWAMPDGREDVLYKSVHAAHPCTVWTMQNKKNYDWHYQHFCGLAQEFKYRYGKEHMSYTKLADILYDSPDNISHSGELTPFALAMKQYPECVVENNPVKSYRNFYVADKLKFAKWERGRPSPTWWQQAV